MIGDALSRRMLWPGPASLPVARWSEYGTRIAQEGNTVHKPVRDAYRKLGQTNDWVRTRRTAMPTQGLIVNDLELWRLMIDGTMYSRLSGLPGVIKHATDVLSKLAERPRG
jgi:hypothetical protein